jgi:glycerol-3-phosphate dehydrogenase
MAQTLGDVVFRRTDLATGRFPGRTALSQCASVLAAELGWSAAEQERQIDEVVSRFPR